MASPNAKKRIMDLLGGTYATTGYYGLGDLVANTDDLIDQIYTSPTYSDQDRADIATWYANPYHAIAIKGEYPRTNADLPAIYLWRVSDGESPYAPIGDGFGYDEDSDTGTQVALWRGTFLQEQLQIEIWAGPSPGIRDALYLAVRELFLRGRRYLDEADIKEAEWANGRDGQDYDPTKKPQIIHKAGALITYRVPLTWVEREEAILGIATHAEGYAGGRVTAGSFEDDS